jgi:hypothetical protein
VSSIRDDGDLPPAVCDFCGEQILEDDQACPALDEGVCRP